MTYCARCKSEVSLPRAGSLRQDIEHHVRSREHTPSPDKVDPIVQKVVERTEQRLDLARHNNRVHCIETVKQLAKDDMCETTLEKLRKENGKLFTEAEKALARDRCMEECMVLEGAWRLEKIGYPLASRAIPDPRDRKNIAEF